MLIDERARVGLPRLTLRHVLVAREHTSLGGLDDVEHQSEQSSLAGSVVTNQSD